MPRLVLLGHHRNGIPPLQLLPPAIPAKRRERSSAHAHEHRLSELRHHIGRRGPRLLDRVLHGGYQVHWSQVHHRRFDAAHGHHPVPFHALVGPELPASHDLSRGFLPEHHVWRVVRLVRFLLSFFFFLLFSLLSF